MRVNVYGEELTSRVEVTSKTVTDRQDEFTFYGVRFWLKFPNQPWWIHRKVDGEEDDDSTAITFWTDDRERLAQLLYDAGDALTPELPPAKRWDRADRYRV